MTFCAKRGRESSDATPVRKCCIPVYGKGRERGVNEEKRKLHYLPSREGKKVPSAMA